MSIESSGTTALHESLIAAITRYICTVLYGLCDDCYQAEKRCEIDRWLHLPGMLEGLDFAELVTKWTSEHAGEIEVTKTVTASLAPGAKEARRNLMASQVSELAKLITADAATKAKRGHLQPRTFTADEIEAMRTDRGAPVIIGIPSIGAYKPDGWDRVSLSEVFDGGQRGMLKKSNEGYGAYFVDKTGFGNEQDPALTVDEFLSVLRPGYGYAIVADGPYQAHVGAFIRKLSST